MTFIEKPLSLIYFRRRLEKIENFKKKPFEVQDAIFNNLIKQSVETEWGIKHKYKNISSIKDFREEVPIQSYETLEPYFIRMLEGEQNVLWSSKINWFSKSSGTTTGTSKYIPVSKETLFDCHYEAGKALMGTYINNCEDTRLLTGKNISVIGSFSDKFGKDVLVGDISAILSKNLPSWADNAKIPPKEIAYIPNWDEKIIKIAHHVVDKNVTSLLGVPSWMSVILRKTCELSGKSVMEMWPNLEVFFHGGVSFEPYREMYSELIDNPNMNYINVYNASEGFFAFQDTLDNTDMLLLLDYNIFFEFVPIGSTDEHHALSLDEVEVGKNYALVISNDSGLWRYKIGDTIQFTSLNPFKIKVTGRTKSFINVVGEEVIVNNSDTAIAVACKKTNAVMEEYTVAPRFLQNGQVVHEWYIEFKEEPEDKEAFIDFLDEALQENNSDYKVKRYNSMVLQRPLVKFLPTNTFYKWFQTKNKLGGQNKVVRLSEKRTILDEIDTLLNN